jgi:catechol 2,3-dioxygenase
VTDVELDRLAAGATIEVVLLDGRDSGGRGGPARHRFGRALVRHPDGMTTTHTSIGGWAPSSAPSLPAALRLGVVYLTVSDLDRSLAFYADGLGLRVISRDEREAALSAGGEALLVLHGEPGASRAGRHAGLYHFAFLHSSREELARTTLRLAANRTMIDGASDHGISEALYLSDPDGNGVELAADRPREVWPDLSDTSWLAGGPAPLDLHGLLGLVAGEEPRTAIDPALVVGHLHLHVGDVPRGLAFYRDVLGFELMTDVGSAAFASAGGYHHHVAFNVWRGRGVPAAPAGTVGLRHWTVVLPSATAVGQVRARVEAAGLPVEPHDGGFLVRDPWDIAVAFVAEASR